MPKKTSCLLMMLFLVKLANAQVQLQDLSVADALNKARAENKIAVFILRNLSCGQCYEMIKTAFESPSLGRSFNASAITVVAEVGSAVSKSLDSAYNVGSAMGLLFVDGDGTLLNRFYSASTLSQAYADQLDKALKKKSNPDLVYSQALKDYKEGKRDFNLLYTLVAKKNEAQIAHDELTEEMLIFAPHDSATSLSFLRFVAEQAPVIGTTADIYLRKNQQLFNDVWYTMSLQQRVTINRTLIEKSKQKAIREHNINFARRVAMFTAGTYNERTASRKALDKTMLDYFKGVNDTANFLLGAVRFYDQYLMTISADSAVTLDSIRRKEFLESRINASRAAIAASSMPSGAIIATESRIVATNSSEIPAAARFFPIAAGYGSELNDGAWSLYTYTHDITYTAKALDWAKRAIEFNNNPAIMDTYARLLYRTGNTKAAIEWEEKAIAQSRLFRTPAGEYEGVVAKMKKGSGPIDQY